MKILKSGLIVCLVLFAVASILYLKSDIDPQVWQPGPLPQLIGKYAANDHMQPSTNFSMPVSYGPEDIARDDLGRFYTGLHDGSIIRFDADNKNAEVIANTNGRPLGMQFDQSGNLIIADAERGLLSMNSSFDVTLLTDTVDGEVMKFVDDLDISDDGIIWFSDASTRFGYGSVMKNFLEANHTGRLLSFDPSSNQTSVHMDGLFFANGVALGPNDEFVLVNETGAGRIHRLWLKGDKQGRRDVFIDGLPGNPDNLSFNHIDTFWVALPNTRLKSNENASDQIFLRKLLGGLPISWLAPTQKVGFVIGLDVDGKLSKVAFNPDSDFHTITSVNQWNQQLYLGSLLMDNAAVIPIPPPLDDQ